MFQTFYDGNAHKLYTEVVKNGNRHYTCKLKL